MTSDRTVDLGFARLDVDRAARTGTPEVVFAAGKTPAETVACLAGLLDAGVRPAWATRVDDATAAAIRDRWPEAVVDEQARCAVLGPLPEPVGAVLVLSAGTSDGPVAAEVAATLAACGVDCRRVDDVGVAGIHRVLAVAPDLAEADAVVVVAGMDGALPSVVAGLTDRLVVAVPTSVGYGAAFDGLAALLTMLTACAPGVLVVNIDNGFGAGVAAARIARSAQR
ncbi:nickel pincer cofactor biosynthesis protein LarB [Blastococcus saxobsidens]|uniref:Putative 1-(5-Phosphoribosyl)-5-amino-4-imidazole-carboxylate (AIR) carboxylase n=1 Tax=Blastococcus saxobsidens (strain DD2) TaxID=1146883 RepID=H6RVU4_BLASD|nr:nickel pincer cofactor biosynthesis protein LarB [Blastococcus saxobsidens]CCG04574.1 Putative 1-(5-Phosphoribosyl)-5-amino-4-imidazole-carboxylate (AIR) carboxylase [Blastococcus saxobsidens DD2]